MPSTAHLNLMRQSFSVGSPFIHYTMICLQKLADTCFYWPHFKYVHGNSVCALECNDFNKLVSNTNPRMVAK
jgi:hypothetical protein